jgi:glycine/D-amino acid oxidase-like deaminating enzyme
MPDRTSFFEHETWTAGVIGLGYVGLPLAVNAVQRGLRAVGFDVDPGAGQASFDELAHEICVHGGGEEGRRPCRKLGPSL